ncbi:uncharacterized protein LOC126561810 [Anopheles maculipalpis]|uniref:uncharacterized protein LOC126561810 n=1 Tax=Anopheles maculipalpis TaxID=1496333 RepID=UPI00215949AD|nr:uncharacterized protein LOC126561810 [Anopheles maculipalpis]
MFKVSFSGLRERDVVSDLKKSLFCIWFQLVVVILCFATLLVSTGSALKKDEYEINIKHGSYAVHQRHVNVDEGTSRSVPLAPTIAPGSASKENGQQRNEQFFGAVNAEREGGAVGEGERISTTLTVPKPTVPSAKQVTSGGEVSPSVKPIKSIDFNAVSPGLEEVPLQATIFQGSRGRGQNRVLSYQSVEYYPPDEATTERAAIVKSISAQDFYNTPQLRERGPVLFSTEPTTTTTTAATTVKPAGKLLKSIPKSAVEENEEIYLLLKYENPKKKLEVQTNAENGPEGGDQNQISENRERQGTVESSRVRTSQPSARQSAGTRKRPQAEEGGVEFLQESLRAGASFTTVGYFVSDSDTTTPMTPVSTSTKNSVESNPTTESPGWSSQVRVSSSKLRNSYGDYLSAEFKDFEDSIRPIEENVEEAPEGETDEVDEGSEETVATGPADIDANMDIIEMTRILAGRQGGLTISEFNRLFKDYLKKEITVQDLDEFKKLEKAAEETPKEAPSVEDPTKSFDIRAENGKKIAKASPVGSLPGPTAAQKQQLDQLKMLINKGSLKPGRKEKVVKIGYGGSKSFQGVYKSQKFLEKVKSERTPVPADGLRGGLEYRQQQPVREIGPMAYVDNPVFGFVLGGRARAGPKDGEKSANGGQSYVKFQKIS